MGLLKIIRWILSVLLALAGFFLLSDGSAIAGFLWIFAGALLLPPVTSKIPPFKRRKAILAICCAALIFSGALTIPQTKPSDSRQGKQSQESSSIRDGEAPAKTEPLNKEDVSKWIKAKLTGKEPETVSEEIMEWGRANENEFFKVWRKASLKQIKGWEDSEDYVKTAEDVTKACNIYKETCGSNKKIEDMLQDAKTVSSFAKDNKKLTNKYNIDILSDREKCNFNTYYITQQLNTSYSDNLAGKLQEEMDSYVPKEYLDWIAYDVDYAFDNPICGNTCQMVIQTDVDEPFERADAYYLAYMDTGETITLGDSRGFSQKVPVCRMLGYGDAVKNDFSKFISNLDTCYTLCQGIEQTLKTGKSVKNFKTADLENAIPDTWIDADNADIFDDLDSETDLGDVSNTTFFMTVIKGYWKMGILMK